MAGETGQAAGGVDGEMGERTEGLGHLVESIGAGLGRPGDGVGWRGLAVGVEHGHERLRPRDAVHQRVMGPVDEHHAAVGQPVEERQVPQGPAAVEGLGLDGHRRRQYGDVVTGCGHGAGVDVASDVEVVVIDPQREGGLQRRVLQTLTEPGDGHEVGLDHPADVVDAQPPLTVEEGTALEPCDPTDVQRDPGTFGGQEAGVEGAEVLAHPRP